MRGPIERVRKGTKAAVRRGFDKLGFELQRKGSAHPDFDPELIALCQTVEPYTLTSVERIAALANAVEYVVRKGIEGDFVECGVWHGGSAMAMALTLRRLGAGDRNLWLYDTFTVMPDPGAEDVDLWGQSMRAEWDRHAAAGQQVEVKSTEAVRAALRSTDYDLSKVHFVEGMVEETIPAHAPERIALLRLDTDWYQSTRHELEQLYPRVAAGGVLIVDDYGHFRGARQAVDEYFAGDPVMLNRIDYSGRLVVK